MFEILVPYSDSIVDISPSNRYIVYILMISPIFIRFFLQTIIGDVFCIEVGRHMICRRLAIFFTLDAASSQAHKKRLRESNENSHELHELSNHEEAYEDANSKFSIII